MLKGRAAQWSQASGARFDRSAVIVSINASQIVLDRQGIRSSLARGAGRGADVDQGASRPAVDINRASHPSPAKGELTVQLNQSVHVRAGQANHPPTLVQALAGQSAPRYTSYPTALQFSNTVGADAYAHWLGEVGPEPVSIYVHVPFCRRLCWYCGCATQATGRAQPIAAYAETLRREVGLVADTIGRPLRVQALHFGGGSPDTLAVADLEAIFGAVDTRFRLTEDAEIAVEIDPANVSAAWITAAGRLGLNRASLGVQTFAPHVQAAVNRPQSFETVERVVKRLREAGVASINFDLMYGLPRQTLADVIETVEDALRLTPDRLAVFGYAHVPWAKPHQRLIYDDELPGAAARLAQAEAAADRLIAAGYTRIGLDHFALPTDPLAKAFAEGRMRRNFQGYTADQATTLIGLGPSAISRLPHGYAQNAATTRIWSQAIAEDRLATARGLVLTAADDLRADLIEALMCYGEVDLDRVCKRWGAGAGTLAAEREMIEQFRVLGLVQVEGGRVRLTETGRPLVRTVCTAFDRYFSSGLRRHAQAI